MKIKKINRTKINQTLFGMVLLTAVSLFEFSCKKENNSTSTSTSTTSTTTPTQTEYVAFDYNGNHFESCPGTFDYNQSFSCGFDGKDLTDFVVTASDPCKKSGIVYSSRFILSAKLFDTSFYTQETKPLIHLTKSNDSKFRSLSNIKNFFLKIDIYDSAKSQIFGHFGGILINDFTKEEIKISNGIFKSRIKS